MHAALVWRRASTTDLPWLMGLRMQEYICHLCSVILETGCYLQIVNSYSEFYLKMAHCCEQFGKDISVFSPGLFYDQLEKSLDHHNFECNVLWVLYFS